jgi:hypothetical protein
VISLFAFLLGIGGDDAAIETVVFGKKVKSLSLSCREVTSHKRTDDERTAKLEKVTGAKMNRG